MVISGDEVSGEPVGPPYRRVWWCYNGVVHKGRRVDEEFEEDVEEEAEEEEEEEEDVDEDEAQADETDVEAEAQ